MIDLKAKPFFLTDTQVEWVSEKLKQLTVRQKVGQIFCLMGGDYGKKELINLVSEYYIGGVLYRPAPSKRIRENFSVLDTIAQIPLLKAANLEEGGSGGVSDGTFFGWPMGVAATGELSVCEKFAKVCASEGRSVGINWTFSPVCDLDLNFRNPITNVRTFGSNVGEVMAFARKYVLTVQGLGMAACAKHFPGDGCDSRDQHLHPTYNDLTAEDWYDSYGNIYRTLIDDGLLSIMAGHIVQPNVSMERNPALTYAECLPASLSKELLDGVLRKRFGFNGVITTDATIMSGYCQAMPRKDAIPTSIAAGCDMIVFSTNFYEDYQYILTALDDGRLTIKRLDEAVERVLALKAKVAYASEMIEPLLEAKRWQAECTDKSITLVKNIQDVLPITTKRFPNILLVPLGNDCGISTRIAECLLAQGFCVVIFDETTDELHGTSGLPKGRLTLYLANYETASNQTSTRINWCKKHALDNPRFVNEETSVFVSFANPYHLYDVPRIKTYINAYGSDESIIDAVVSKLLGKSPFKGESPVDAFCGLDDTHL